jgi:uncharacterized phiE125 gp8 family phage protein
MALFPLIGPQIEPVSVAELKAHLRIDGTAEDAVVASLITTARLQIEAALALALITQSWSWTFDRWPRRASVELPVSPVQQINAVTVVQAGGAATMPSSAYILDGHGIGARLIARDNWPQPSIAALGVEIRLVAGFGTTPADVPAAIRQALLVLAAHWHSRRDADGRCNGTAAGAPSCGPLPPDVNDLLAPYRRSRL